MAKVIRTEKLSLGGDKIRLTATSGNLIVNTGSGENITPITSTNEINSDISSLAVRASQENSDISSLAALDNSINSTITGFSAYNIYSLQTPTLSTGPGSSTQTITLSNRAFLTTPNLTATIQSNANDPMIAVAVSNIAETTTSGVYEATFQFSDELPVTGETNQATDYRLNILAAVSAGDIDLDTIIDPVDDDRDGDGVPNELDAYPDDGTKSSSQYKTLSIDENEDWSTVANLGSIT